MLLKLVIDGSSKMVILTYYVYVWITHDFFQYNYIKPKLINIILKINKTYNGKLPPCSCKSGCQMIKA